MRAGFYPKMAFDGIRKNKRMYLPYLLASVGMVMMYYIVSFLQYSDTISYLPGAKTLQSILSFGGWVIAIFVCLFLFYTNSFLMRRRKKEFGLYNILGMGKWKIGRILFWESLIVAGLSLGLGLAAGIAFSKAAELGLVNIMKEKVTYRLSVSWQAIRMTFLVFGPIFALLLLNSIRQIRVSTALSLLRSENEGEKPPKANWILGLAGLAVLGTAYYMAVKVEDSVAALVLFFAAAMLVIAGTYLLFIFGSVLFCRLLQKKKRYYYKANHFVAVSSMVYRMKRNGAGLASICILATMVLVMISSTASLYFGEEDALLLRYPREINLSMQLYELDAFSQEQVGILRDRIDAAAREEQAAVQNVYEMRCAVTSGLLKNGTVEMDVREVSVGLADYSSIYRFYFVPLEDYNRKLGTDERLEDGEALLCSSEELYDRETISFRHGRTFRVAGRADERIAEQLLDEMLLTPGMVLVVPDLESALEGMDRLADYAGDRMVTLRWDYGFDTGLTMEGQAALRERLVAMMQGEFREQYALSAFSCSSRELARDDFYSLYGGLFYIGITLSIVFLFAAVLIIYYKQISEGYEDQARFGIMKKVGMTGREIRKSINSQLLTVFFLPLIAAAVHLAFAFSMIRTLLYAFNLNNIRLFTTVTLISFGIFALFYMIVYRITSNAYYAIVSGAKEE